MSGLFVSVNRVWGESVLTRNTCPDP